MMSEHEFAQIRRQLELWEASDPATLDLGPAREMFADCRGLLRKVVSAAQVTNPRETNGGGGVNVSDLAALTSVITKQSETIAAQADQITSLTGQNIGLMNQLLAPSKN